MAAKTIDIRGILTKNLSVTALFMALILGGIIMAVCGYNPFEAYGAILEGAFAGKKAICQTLVQATPLIFAGLAYTVAKRANLINLGIEGQLYIGALGTSVIALMPLNLPMGVWLPLALAADSPLAVILSGIIFGALRAGSMVLNRTTGIPTEFIDVIQALIILLVAAPLLVKEILRIKGRKAGKKGGRKG